MAQAAVPHMDASRNVSSEAEPPPGERNPDEEVPDSRYDFRTVPSEVRALGDDIQRIDSRTVSGRHGPLAPNHNIGPRLEYLSSVLSTRSDGPPEDQSADNRTLDAAAPSSGADTGLFSRFMVTLSKALRGGTAYEGETAPQDALAPKLSTPDTTSSPSRGAQGRGVVAEASPEVNGGGGVEVPPGMRRRSVPSGNQLPRGSSPNLATSSTNPQQASTDVTLTSPRQQHTASVVRMDTGSLRSPRHSPRFSPRETVDATGSDIALTRVPTLMLDSLAEHRNTSGADSRARDLSQLMSPSSNRRSPLSPASHTTNPASPDAPSSPSAGATVAAAATAAAADAGAGATDTTTPAEVSTATAPRYKPQRSLSRIFDQMMTPFPRIQERASNEIDLLMLKCITGICLVTLASTLFGIAAILPTTLTFYYAGYDVFRQSPQPTPARQINYDRDASNVTISWAIRGDDVWRTLHSSGHEIKYAVIEDRYHWFLLVIGITLMILKVALPFLYYIVLFKRCEKKLRRAFIFGSPLLVLLGVFVWVWWMDYVFTNQDPFNYHFLENIIVLIGVLLLWPYMSIFRKRWKWAKFRAAVVVIFIPLITLVLTPVVTSLFLVPAWISLTNNFERIIIAGAAFPMIAEMVMLPLMSMTVLVWNYYGIVKLEPLLFCIFPVSLFYNFHMRFLLYSIDSISIFVISVVLLAVFNRLHRLSLDVRIAAISELINGILSVCGTFPHNKIFNVSCLAEPASQEIQAQINIQDLVIQYVSTSTAAVAAIVLGMIPNLTSGDRTDRMITYLVVQYLVDMVADVGYMFLAGYRTKYPFGGKPLVGAWARRCKKYNYLVGVLAGFALLWAINSLTTNLCQLRVIRHQNNAVDDVTSYASIFCDVQTEKGDALYIP
eukprot:GEMP01003312.1.p1 GENE.GEMP01003312.1~~GEMP01003312.1.p1  ORF type:complete len:892 (+),score=136.59 GEMP01003312.1:305-2980(+)